MLNIAPAPARQKTQRVALMAPSWSVPDAFCQNADHLFKLTGGNTGNVAFVFALHQLLSPNVDVVTWDVSPELVKEKYDAVVFACANQLGPHTDLGWLADRLAAMDRPIIAIGLGAQAKDMSQPVEVTPGTRRWLDVIAAQAPSSAPNIGVRGAYTLAQLEHLGQGAKGAVVGCPSNFIHPDPTLGQTIAKKHAAGGFSRVAVPAGLHHWTGVQRIEERLADMVEACSGIYIAQSEIDMIRLARDESDLVDPKVLEQIRAYIRPGLRMPEFIRWMRRYAVTFTDAASWIDAMRKFDFVVGPRFHGVMLAMQAGTPGGVIAHDSRTLELCNTMGIPVRDYKEIPEHFVMSDLAELFPFDGAAYDRQRALLANALAEMLSHAGIESLWANLRVIGTSRAEAA
jgi:polysaccharide pyruvyl transferase WcaK-like protein